MAFEGIKREGDYIKVSAFNPTFEFEGVVVTPGPNYKVSISSSDDSDQSTRARIEVKKNKFFGYDINRFLDGKYSETYQRIGFSLDKYVAGRKAHQFAIDIAKEVSEACGMKLIDTSQKDNVDFQINRMRSNLGRQII